MSKSAIVLFAHGSRDDKWSEPLQLIRESIAAIDKEVPVSIAFLEFMQPDFATSVDALVAQHAEQIRVIPLFLAAGAHTRKDLTALIEAAQQKHPEVRFTVAAPIGEVDSIRAAISSWVATQL